VEGQKVGSDVGIIQLIVKAGDLCPGLVRELGHISVSDSLMYDVIPV